jgi:hypothetical protein
MYKREIKPPLTSPIEKGVPLPGTWTEAFQAVDLLSVEYPKSFLYAKSLIRKRIKEWQSFVIQDEHFILNAVMGNLKHYCWAQVILYDKQAKKHCRFRKIIPFDRWQMPASLSNALVESHSYGFFLRIHDWLDAHTIRVDLDIEAARKRPALTARIEYDVNRGNTTPMVVNLLFDQFRSMYTYKVVTPVRVDMAFDGRHITMRPETTMGFFGDFKGFYPYSMRSIWVTACAADEKGRYGFSVAETQTTGTFKNNENALWMNGRLTPLPPVHITAGAETEWIIQDIEGMVDLTFTPAKQIRSGFNALLTRAEYNTPLGYFNGMLLDAEGRRLEVHNLWGMGESLFLRV